MINLIIIGVTAAVVLVALSRTIRIVPQARAYIVERLGSYKKPSKIVLQTEPLPRTPVGKLARKVLREPFWQGVDRRVSGA